MENKNELYSFNVYSTKEVDEVKESVNAETNEVTTVTKKVKKEVPTKVVIKKPTRKQVSHAEDWYARMFNKYLSEGYLTKAMVTKRYADQGGFFTNEDARALEKKKGELAEQNARFVALSIKGAAASDEDKKNLEECVKQLSFIRDEIARIESNYGVVFQHTAEMKAFNDVILWYCFHLVRTADENGVETPLYTGKDMEDLMEDFYKKEEENEELYRKIARKSAYFISYYYAGAASEADEFQALEENLEKV